MTRTEMAGYLRRSNTAHDYKCSDAGQYYIVEMFPEEFKGKMVPDEVINGIDYLAGCDYETVIEDAAKMLEECGDVDTL